mgnify:CR=1 FL=1
MTINYLKKQGVQMNKLNRSGKKFLISLATLAACMSTTPQLVAETSSSKELKIGVINFKYCVETSKMGKQEQASFEALKKQAEQIIHEKEKELQQISAKLDDVDYLDSLSKEAEAELKHKFRSLNQQLSQNQQQLYQTLTQANFKIVQKLTDAVHNAAKVIAKESSFDLILNDDACFFYDQAVNKSDEVVKYLDDSLEKSSS